MSDLGHGCKNVFPPKTARNRAVAAILVGLTVSRRRTTARFGWRTSSVEEWFAS